MRTFGLPMVTESEAAASKPWRLKLKFWGTRGSTPTPHARYLGYGGNTSCVELMIPTGEHFIFDAGTGIREMGGGLGWGPGKPPIFIFFTHFHWDHIQGLPFFAPLYDPDRSLNFYSSPFTSSLRATLAKQMSAPCFPVDFETLRSRCTFTELDKEPFRFGKLTIWAYEQHHPNGACGYRIEYDGAVAVYATDREHDNSVLDTVFAEHVQDADILIHDAQYTLEEFEKFRGRGHSTWLEAVRVARAHNVKRLALFHHDPLHDDNAVSQIVNVAQQDFDGTFGAREGDVLTIAE